MARDPTLPVLVTLEKMSPLTGRHTEYKHSYRWYAGEHTNDSAHRGCDFEELNFLCLSHSEMNVETRWWVKCRFQRSRRYFPKNWRWDFPIEIPLTLQKGVAGESEDQVLPPLALSVWWKQNFSRVQEIPNRTAVSAPFPGGIGSLGK